MAENGYVWHFHPSHSAVERDPGDIESYLVLLTDTANMVDHWIECLHQWHRKLSGTLYMYNVLRIQSLLAEPCRIGIGTCSIWRKEFWEFPMEVKVWKNAKLPYYFGSGVVTNGVATLLWMDSSPVTMMSTVHPRSGEDSLVLRKRKHISKN